ISAAEIICNDTIFNMTKQLSTMRLDRMPKFQNYYEWCFDIDNATSILLKQFGIGTLAKFEIDDKKLAISACGALVNYINETQKRALNHISGIKLVQNNKFLIVDANTRRNLELVENARDGSKKATLLWSLDKTRTSMGARNLRRWLEQPLRDSKMINARLGGVSELVNNAKVRTNLYENIAAVKDIERLTSKLAYGNPSPRDFVALKYSLMAMPKIKEILSICESQILTYATKNIFLLEDICKMLQDAIDDDCPILTKDGGYIKSGYDKTLDEYRDAKTKGNEWLAALEANEREKTGIKTLKIGYNRVFGYYIELSKTNVEKAPFYFVRKQTVTSG
ncbi:MAG: DNA mismatch repair protein MutS, partial [Clostridia bacterium]